MSNGLVILGLIGLLFLCIYGYAYGTVAYEEMKAKKARKLLLKIEEERRQVKIGNQKVRDEKLAKLRKRREEIRQELIELENKKLMRTQLKGDQMKVERMKKQINEQQVG